MTSRVSTVLGVAGLICGCATTYGPAFSKAAPRKHDAYLYGAHVGAPSAGESSEGDEGDDAETDASEVTTDVAPEKKRKRAKRAEPAMVEQDGGVTELLAALTPGTYKGTDWVTIDLPGLPGGEQVDEKARVVLATVSSGSRLSFTVLDTSSGNELCSVEGSIVNDLIAFDAGQSCFEGILGVPMQTALYEGEGRMVEGALEVTLGVELTLTSPDGDGIVGDLSYRFEGKLTPSASSKE